MTIEELFAEEYKELKKDNEELKSCIIRTEKDLYHAENENTELRLFLLSLNLRINTNYNGKKYIEITNIVTTISEDNKFYDLISKFATEESEKKESEEEE